MAESGKTAPRNANRRRLMIGTLAAAACATSPRWVPAAETPAARLIDVIGAPSNLGLRPLRPGHVPGAAKAPAALRRHRLVERVGARDRGDVVAPAYDPAPDPGTGYRNGAGLAAYSPRLADRIGTTLDDGRFALVLGGDCSVLVGSALALKRRGRYGLLFIDGHSDFYFPRKPRPLSAAGMDLALATGHGPDAIAGIDGLNPYIREEDAVVFGYRDRGTSDEVEIERFDDAAFARYPLQRVRELGIVPAMHDALKSLEQPSLRGFWIHLDVDVLDPGFMPAVDSPDPGGMRFAELEDTLALALASSRVVGMEVDIYDPDLDPDGRYAEQLVAMLERASARAGRFGRSAA